MDKEEPVSFTVGDLVTKTWGDYNGFLGIVTKIGEPLEESKTLQSFGVSYPQVIFVRWFSPSLLSQDGTYWIEDLKLVSKAK